MPEPDLEIDDIVVTYSEQLDRFRKLCRMIGECSRRILNDNGILCTVSWRAKTPDSLARKLEIDKFRLRILGGKPFHEAVGDLAAVRICTYRDSDRSRVIELLTNYFRVDPTSIDVVDIKRREEAGPRHWYSGTHLQAAFNSSDLGEDDRNISNLTCEVQVCSLLSHAWNEVEHDTNYKASLPAPDELQRLLWELGECKAKGDELVERVLASAESHFRACQSRPIEDFEDFKAAIHTSPSHRKLIVDDDFLWRELHRAALRAGAATAGDIWTCIGTLRMSRAPVLMNAINEQNIFSMQIVGGHAIDDMARADSFLLEPENDSHIALLALLPHWYSSFLSCGSEVIRAMAVEYERVIVMASNEALDS